MDGGPGSGRYPKGSGGNVDPELVKQFTDRLVGVKSASGVTVNSISNHAMRRLAQRDISVDTADNLNRHAPIIYPGNTPDTICQQKDDFRMVINKKTGNIVSFVRLDEMEE